MLRCQDRPQKTSAVCSGEGPLLAGFGILLPSLICARLFRFIAGPEDAQVSNYRAYYLPEVPCPPHVVMLMLSKVPGSTRVLTPDATIRLTLLVL